MVANKIVLMTEALDAAVPVAVHGAAAVVLALVDPAAVSVATVMVVHWALMPVPFAREQAESMGAKLGRQGWGGKGGEVNEGEGRGEVR